MYNLIPKKPLRLEFELFTKPSKSDCLPVQQRVKMTLKTLTIFLGLCMPFFLLTIWAIVDAAQKDFGTVGKKAFWWLIASIPFVGFIPYFLFGFRKGKKPNSD